MKINLISYLLLATLIAACGGSDSGNSDEFERQDEQLPEPETLQKVYRADLKAVNLSVLDDVEGQAIIRLEDDSFEVNVALRNAPGMEHAQHIRVAKNCPNSASDINGDRIIDLAEAEAVTGTIYIPLDSDLDNVVGDNTVYPNGGFIGAYVYRETTQRAQLVRELGAEPGIDFGNRVILILGSDDDANLPIACGEFTQILGS